MQTSIRVASKTRDALSQTAQDLGGLSLDELLNVLLQEHNALHDIARLEQDPDGLAEYRTEAQALAETGVNDGLGDGNGR